MTAALLLSELRQKGVEVWAEGERLRLRAPRGVLTSELRDALQDRKGEILDLLTEARSRRAGEPGDAKPSRLEDERSSATDTHSAASVSTSGATSAPLSFTQERLWFVDRLAGGAAYNIGLALRVAAPVRPEILQRALDELLRRHAALRTTCALEGGRPVQRVAPPSPVALEQLDLEASGAAGAPRALELAQAAFARPFDLQRDALLRATLFRLADGTGVLALVTHHFAADGWSMQILARELQALEAAFAAGRPSPLPEPGLTFAEVARAERAADDVSQQGALEFWRACLTPLPAPLELPADHAAPAQPSGRGARVALELDVATSDRLRALARQARATPFMALLSAFGALLRRVTGQSDVTLGSAVSQRARAALEQVVGPLSNNVVLRLDLGGDPTYRKLLARARSTCLAAWEHQALPFERLVQELQPQRDARRNPLFQVLFLVQQAGPARPEAGARLSQLEVEPGVAVLDLGLALLDRAAGFCGALEYSLDLFEPETARRLAQRFVRLTRALVERPDTPLARLDVLADDERRALLHDWNATGEPRADVLLHELVARQAARTPAAVAVVGRGGRLSYAELHQRATRLARRLAALGVGRESIVGLCLSPSLDLPTAMLAVLQTGAAYLPLDPSHPRERLRFLLRDAGAGFVVSERSFGTLFEELPCLWLDDEIERWSEGGDVTPLPRRSHGDGVAIVLYTSGSTGTPKGAALRHSGAVNQVLWRNAVAALGPGDVVLHASSLAFDVSVWDFFGPLAAGACLALPSGDGPPDARRLRRLMREHGVTVLQLAVSRLRALLDEPALPDAPRLRVAFAGGESLEARVAARALDELTDSLHHLYGPTEASIDVTRWECHTTDAGAALPIGRPIANQRVYLLDAQAGPVPVGTPGELYVGGAGLARGYVGRGDLTAECFVPDPFGAEPGARLYRTGDLARWRRDGVLQFLGRRDQQVKVRGVRIELQEIEAALRAHPGVREACADVRPDADGAACLVAWVVLEHDLEPTELRAFLRQRLPAAMWPAAYVRVDQLPLTPTGKVDRRALRAPERAPASSPRLAPRDDVEIALGELWCELLGRVEVGVDEDFFEAGGHSLLAARFLARVEERLGVELPLRRLFEQPTIAALAEALRAARVEPAGAPLAVQAPPLGRRPAGVPAPLSFAQQRLWFLEQLETRAGAYRIPLVLRLDGVLDEPALAGALAEIVRRHEVLRTVFVSGDGQPLQLVGAAPQRVLEQADLSDLPVVARAAAFGRLAAATLAEPMSLERGPLFRALLVRLGERSHGLVLDMHHAVSDGWSLGVLLRELQTLYADLQAGRAPSLPALEVQYGDFAAWQRAWLSEAALAPRLEFWRRSLEGVPVLALSGDRPRPARPSLRGRRAGLAVPAPVAQAVHELARAEGATPFMALLAVYVLFLRRHSGQQDVAVGTPVASRPRPALEGLIGLFVNTLVLRAERRGAASWRELLRQVRDACLAAFAHQDVPFERLVHELHVARSLGHTPLFQALFILQNLDVALPQLAGLEVRAEQPESETVTFDIVLSLTPGPHGLRGSLDASADLFDETTVARLARRFETLLAAATTSPDAPLEALPLLDAREQRQVLVAWNAALSDFGLGRAPASLTIHALVREQARRTPEATAVLDASEGGASSTSYAELLRRADVLAARLRAVGVGRGARVAVCLERSLDLLVALFAALEVGGAYVPLDPTQPAARLRAIAADAQPDVLLYHARTARLVDELTARSPRSPEALDRQTAVEPDDPNLDGGPSLARAPDPTCGTLRTLNLASLELAAFPAVPVAESPAGPDDVAYVLYTSGSTGIPKGVLVPHGALCETILWRRAAFALQAGDCILQNIPVGFDPSLWQIFGALGAGARLVLAHHRGHQDFPHLTELIAAHGVTVTDFAPAMLRQFLAGDGLDACRSLRHVFVGGEALPDDLQRDFQARFPECGLHHVYGPTETAIDAACWTCRPDDAPGPIPIGRPLANRPVYVLDEALAPVGAGLPGELCIGGRGLAHGYLGRAEASAERFVPDAFGERPGARLYRTGDVVRWRADGALEFLGRRDEQVKVRGQRVELGEIERQLEGHPLVAECAVVALGHGDEKRLIGYVTPRPGGARPQAATLRAQLRRALPDYMVPAALLVLDELPRLSSGKVDRAKLRVAAETAPDAASVTLAGGAALPGALPPEREPVDAASVAGAPQITPPRNELERRIAEVWRAALRVDAVGVDDNFFDLGGHSLLLVQVHRELRRCLPRELSMVELFEHPTIAALARHVAAADEPQAAPGAARQAGRRQAAALRRLQAAAQLGRRP